jgi:hypothetical protein
MVRELPVLQLFDAGRESTLAQQIWLFLRAAFAWPRE